MARSLRGRPRVWRALGTAALNLPMAGDGVDDPCGGVDGDLVTLRERGDGPRDWLSREQYVASRDRDGSLGATSRHRGIRPGGGSLAPRDRGLLCGALDRSTRGPIRRWLLGSRRCVHGCMALTAMVSPRDRHGNDLDRRGTGGSPQPL